MNLTMATIALDILCICALIVYNFEQVTVALHSTFWISAVWLLHGWCHVKLLPCWRKVYVHHTAMHQFTVSLYSKLHICMLHVCLAETCHLHFWQNGWDLLYATAVTRVWNKYRNKRQHREENSPTVPARTQTPETFWSQVHHSTAEPSPLSLILISMSIYPSFFNDGECDALHIQVLPYFPIS